MCLRTSKRIACGGALCTLLAGLGLLSGCGRGGGEKDGTKTTAAPKVVPVELAAQTLTLTFERPASVEPIEETPVYARIPGYVKKVNVDLGDRIDSEKILAELDVPELEKEWQQKKALVGQADAEVEQANAALEAAAAHVESANALVGEAKAARGRAEANQERWQSEVKRIDKLVKDKVVEDQILVETNFQLKSADAALKEVDAKATSAAALAKEAVAKKKRADADVKAAKARVGVAQAEADRVHAMLNFARIPAPPFKEGVITRRNVHPGHFVQAAGGKTEPLFIVARMDSLRIVVDLPEAEAALIADEDTVKIRGDALKGGPPIEAKITRTSWSLDAKARTLRVEIHLPNKDAKLRPGMYAHVAFTAKHAARFALPVAAVATQGDQNLAYRLADGKVWSTPVKVGKNDGKFVEILQKQTKSGGAVRWVECAEKEVFVEGTLSELSDGLAVTVKGAKD